MSDSAPASNSFAAERLPLMAKAKRWGKLLLDNSPALVGLFVGFAEPSAALIYGGASATVIIAIIAIIVDRVHCHHRWAAGLEASWPKLIPVTFFLMNVAILVLLGTGTVSPFWMISWKDVITTSGIFVAMAMSLCVGQPFVYSLALEALPPEKLQEINATEAGRNIFAAIMRAITIVWVGTMAVLVGVGVVGAIIRETGNKNASTIYGVVAPTLVILFTIRVVQPRVIESSKRRAQAQFTPHVPNSDPSGSLRADLNPNEASA